MGLSATESAPDTHQVDDAALGETDPPGQARRSGRRAGTLSRPADRRDPVHAAHVTMLAAGSRARQHCALLN
jgi:hypothetical protein